MAPAALCLVVVVNWSAPLSISAGAAASSTASIVAAVIGLPTPLLSTTRTPLRMGLIALRSGLGRAFVWPASESVLIAGSCKAN